MQNINNQRLCIRNNKCITQFNKSSPRHQQNLFLCSKDSYKPKYQLLMKKHESVGQKHSNDPKAFIKNSNAMEDIYENSDE